MTGENVPIESKEKPKTGSERAIEILEEALSGTSPKSKNSLIQDAIRCLK